MHIRVWQTTSPHSREMGEVPQRAGPLSDDGLEIAVLLLDSHSRMASVVLTLTRENVGGFLFGCCLAFGLCAETQMQRADHLGGLARFRCHPSSLDVVASSFTIGQYNVVSQHRI